LKKNNKYFCNWCGKIIKEKRHYTTTKQKHHFCNNEHNALWKTGKRYGKPTQVYIKVRCDWCNGIFEKVRYFAECDFHHFCCKLHYRLWRKGKTSNGKKSQKALMFDDVEKLIDGKKIEFYVGNKICGLLENEKATRYVEKVK